MSHEAFIVGSLYLAGFAQTRAPHVGLLIPTSTSEGTLVHIRIDRNISPNWQCQIRTQKIEGDMFLTSLLKIGEPIETDTLRKTAEAMPVPDNGEFGECFPWAMSLVARLNELGVIDVSSIDELSEEFREFVNENRAFARRDKFPNVAVSKYCGACVA